MTWRPKIGIIARAEPERIRDGQRWQPLSLFDMARLAERAMAGEDFHRLASGLRKIDGDWCRWVGRAE